MRSPAGPLRPSSRQWMPSADGIDQKIVIVIRRHLVAPRSIAFVRGRATPWPSRDASAIVMFVPLTTSSAGFSHVIAVVREREARVLRVAAHVPHLEQAVLRVVEDAVAEGHRRGIRSRFRALGVFVVFFPARRGPEDRIRRMIVGTVEDALERRLFDQEVVDEQLPADVDRHDIRTIDEVRRPYRRRLEAAALGRPRCRQADAVVQRFWHGGRRSPATRPSTRWHHCLQKRPPIDAVFSRGQL